MFLCALEDVGSCGLVLPKIRHLTESVSEGICPFALSTKDPTMIIVLAVRRSSFA